VCIHIVSGLLLDGFFDRFILSDRFSFYISKGFLICFSINKNVVLLVIQYLFIF